MIGSAVFLPSGIHMSNDQNVNIRSERLKYITAVVLYGTIGLFLRHVSFPSELVAMCRGIIGSIFIFLYLRIRGPKPDTVAIKNNLSWLVLSGICLGLNWIFLFAAYIETTVAIASLCNYLAPAMVVLIAPAVLHEKLDLRKLPCVFVSLLGVALISGVLDGQKGSSKGIILGLLAAAGFVGIVLCNRQLMGISAMDKAIVQLVVSAATILPYVIIHNRGTVIGFDLSSVLITLMLGILHTGVAYCLYFSGMGTLPVQTVAVLGYLEPVVSVLCSVLLLNEPLSLWGWLGAVLVIGAAAVSEIMPEKE